MPNTNTNREQQQLLINEKTQPEQVWGVLMIPGSVDHTNSCLDHLRTMI